MNKKASKPPLKLYTKTGDKGESNVLAGIRLPKDDAIFEALGTMDELNASLGIVVSHAKKVGAKTSQEKAKPNPNDLVPELLEIQDTLLNVGAIIAGSEKIDMSVASISKLEKRIDFYQQNTRDDWFHTFLLPGGTHVAAHTDLARTICRRLERRLTTLANNPDTRLYIQPQPLKEVQAYINRLSDYLFALRCYINSQAGYEEKEYQPKYLESLKV